LLCPDPAIVLGARDLFGGYHEHPPVVVGVGIKIEVINRHPKVLYGPLFSNGALKFYFRKAAMP
jgi:hypothetical protein